MNDLSQNFLMVVLTPVDNLAGAVIFILISAGVGQDDIRYSRFAFHQQYKKAPS